MLDRLRLKNSVESFASKELLKLQLIIMCIPSPNNLFNEIHIFRFMLLNINTRV